MDCHPVDTWFREGQQHINENLIKKEFISRYVYAERIPKGIWAANGSYTHRVDRLTAIKPPDCINWRRLDGNQCETNACDYDPEYIHRGNEIQEYGIVKLNLQTDWICLDHLYQQQYPLQEIQHLEMHLSEIDRYVRDEFDRVRYTDLSANKVLPFSADAEDCLACCSEAKLDGWKFDRFENGEVNSCYVFACVDPAELDTIGEMSTDLLDQALLTLEYQNRSYSFGEGIQLYDLILPDRRVSNNLVQTYDQNGNNFMSWGQWNINELNRAFGVFRVVGNFAHRFDNHALKYYPDQEYNDNLPPFNPDDMNTWPRFFRVFPYINQVAQNGIKAVPNPDYIQAPFAITNIFSPDVMVEEVHPDVVAYSSATKKDGVVTNTWGWKNPDWDCNVERTKGFWLGKWMMAAQPRQVENGYSYFHRIDTSFCIRKTRCPLPPEPPCQEDVTPYCPPGAQEFSGDGANLNLPKYD